MTDCSFLSRVLNIHKSGVRTALFGCYMAGATLNCCHLGAVCLNYTTMHHDTSLFFFFMQISHIGRVQACSAVTCHLHIRQNDRYLLRATAHTVNSVKEIKSFQQICRLGVKVSSGRRRENTNVQKKDLKTVAFLRWHERDGKDGIGLKREKKEDGEW